MGVLRYSRTILLSTTFLTPAVTALEGTEGASYLLDGESSGFSIDATTYDTITAEVYEGGPVGGTVSVGTSGVFASDNVALDNSILTQAGTSAKMVHWDSAPYVRWTPHNLITNSEAINSWAGTGGSGSPTITTNAAIAPDGTTTADEVACSGTADTRVATSSVSVTAGNPYTVSVYAKQSTEDWILLHATDAGTWAGGVYFDLANGAVGSQSSFGSPGTYSGAIVSVGNGWYRCSVTINAVPLTPVIMHVQLAEANNDNTVGSGDSVYLWGGQIVRGYNANPYLVTTSSTRIGIPQAYDAYEDVFGVLVEPASTNLIQYSEQLDNGAVWGSSGATRTGTAADGPEGGTTTADRLSATSGSSGKYAFQAFTAANTASHTISAYIKSDGGQWIGMCVDGGVQGNGVFFDVINGVLGTVGGGTGTITAIGNGWYRCTATKSATAGSRTLLFEPHSADNEGQTWNSASGAEKFLIWGTQVEESSVATSYIPTLSSTVTRAVDNISALTSSFPYSATKSTMYADFKYSADTSDYRLVFTLNNANDQDAIRAQRVSGGNDFQVDVAASNVSQAAIDPGDIVSDTRQQVTAAIAANDADASLDGGAVVSDASVTMPAAASKLNLGNEYNNSFSLKGHIYRFVYVPRQVETEG